jgi:hypothetical protein
MTPHSQSLGANTHSCGYGASLLALLCLQVSP